MHGRDTTVLLLCTTPACFNTFLSTMVPTLVENSCEYKDGLVYVFCFINKHMYYRNQTGFQTFHEQVSKTGIDLSLACFLCKWLDECFLVA